MASLPSGLTIPGDSLHRMHVTRPKSAKGRTRTTPQVFTQNVEAYACRTSPPPPRLHSGRASSWISQEEMPELIHQPPARPSSSSLNRYRVLPSIGKSGSGDWAREEDLAQQTSALRLGAKSGERQAKALYRGQAPQSARGNSMVQEPSLAPPMRQEPSLAPPMRQEPSLAPAMRQEPSLAPAMRQEPSLAPAMRQEPSLAPTMRQEPTQMSAVWLEPPSLSMTQQGPSEPEPHLLLAIRSHTGQRFEQHFRPSDPLQSVLAAAEHKTGISCKNCRVESMEIPRRSFPNLGLTLQECGIPNKSVLCIHQVESD